MYARFRMSLDFSFFLARRYLRPKRNSVSVITLICIAGVTLGVWIMLVVIAVMAGFAQRAQELLLGFEAHVFVENRLTPDGPPFPLSNWQDLADLLESEPGVSAVQPMVEGLVLADAFGRRSAYRMRAFPDDNPVIREQIQLREGSLDLGEGGAVVSGHVAVALGVGLGDTITLYSQGHLDQVVEAFQEAEREPVSRRHGDTLLALLEDLESDAQAHPTGDDKTVSLASSMVGRTGGTILEILSEQERRPSEQEALFLALDLFSLHEAGIDEGAPDDADERLPFPRDWFIEVFQELDRVAQAPPETDQQAALDRIKQLVLPKELEITGIFDQPPTPTSPSIFVPLHIGQELYSLEDSIHTIALRTGDPYRAVSAARAIMPALPPDLLAIPWMERPDLKLYFQALANERRMMYFALFCIMIVASFCIMVTMITITVEKAKEIGVMKALGARESQIVRVFLLQGMIVGLIGALIGLGLAATTLTFRDEIQIFLGLFGMDPFPAAIYDLERIPALLRSFDIAVICGGAFLLCSLAALPPAWLVARLDPAAALRKE